MFASLLVVAIIGAIAWAGSAVGLGVLFGVVLPYVAVAAFFVGVIWRMVYWAKSPVPFAIPTTGGQERSLDFIKQAKWDCPTTTFGVVRRMFLEVVFFRSLFRNTCADVREFDEVNNGPRTIYFSSKWLWVFSLLFHYCFLLVFIRHFRFFMDPVCPVITWIETIDGIMQVGAPRFFWTGGLLLCALLFLLARRAFNQRLRYISLPNDYFPLFLLIGIVGTGMTASNGAATVTIVVTGDVNGDGKITITDVVKLQSNVAGASSLSGAYAAAADINGDGRVTITDVVQAAQITVGQRTIN